MMIIENRRDEGVRIHHDTVPTIRAAWGTGGGNVPMILDDEKYGIEMYSMANGSHTLEKYGTDISPTLTSRMGTGGNQVPVFVVNKNKANTLRANAGAIKHMADLKGRTVVEHNVYSLDRASFNQGKNAQYNFSIEENKAQTLVAKGPSAVYQDSYCIAGNTIDRKIENGGNGAGVQKDVSYTLNTIDRHAVNDVEPQIVGTLAAADSKGKNGQDINKFPVIESRIRRLTPTECERLQGLPDDWTNVPSVDKRGKEKPASDASRYKAIGNGMAQPCADFIIRRIVECSR